VKIYTIRYRCDDADADTALIVEDECAVAYLFSQGECRLRLARAGACVSLARQLASWGQWTRVPQVAPYTLDGLRALTQSTSRPGARGAATREHPEGGRARIASPAAT